MYKGTTYLGSGRGLDPLPPPGSTKSKGEGWRVGGDGGGREGRKRSTKFTSSLVSLGCSRFQLQLLEWTMVSGRDGEHGAACSEHSCLRQNISVTVDVRRCLWHVGEVL